MHYITYILQRMKHNVPRARGSTCASAKRKNTMHPSIDGYIKSNMHQRLICKDAQTRTLQCVTERVVL